MTSSRSASPADLPRSAGTQKVPAVAGDVDEHRKPTVRFVRRTANELDIVRPKTLVGLVEVVDAKKQPDAPGELITDRAMLAFTAGLREEEACCCTRWTDHHPPFGSSVVRERRLVLDKLEAQHTNEERNRFVVVIDDQRHEVKMHADAA